VKLPFTFGARLFFRLLLPGSVLAVFLWPLVAPVRCALAITQDDWAVFTVLAVAGGWLCGLADDHIYRLAMGRRYWPQCLAELGRFWQRERLASIRLRSERGDREADIDLLDYPFDETGPCEAPPRAHAPYPTRLGNLIAAYESRPVWKYGMDPSVYWPWLWVGLAKDLRDELDERQAMVDGAVYTSFALAVGALLLLAYTVHDAVGSGATLVSLPSLGKLALAGGALAAAYLVYRASLRAHGQFGELFCAVFNRFHHEVDVAPALRQAGGILARPDCSVGAERYRNAARFLRWHVYRPHGATENLPLPNHLGRRG
jgi:hypothetical protein